MDIATALTFLATVTKIAQQGGKFAALLTKAVAGTPVTLAEFEDAVADRIDSSNTLHAKLRALAEDESDDTIPPPPA